MRVGVGGARGGVGEGRCACVGGGCAPGWSRHLSPPCLERWPQCSLACPQVLSTFWLKKRNLHLLAQKAKSPFFGSKSGISLALAVAMLSQGGRSTAPVGWVEEGGGGGRLGALIVLYRSRGEGVGGWGAAAAGVEKGIRKDSSQHRFAPAF